MLMVKVPPEYEPTATVAAAFAEGRVAFSMVDPVFQPNQIYAEQMKMLAAPSHEFTPDPPAAAGPPVIELNGPQTQKKIRSPRVANGGFLPSLSDDPDWDGGGPCCQEEEEWD